MFAFCRRFLPFARGAPRDQGGEQSNTPVTVIPAPKAKASAVLPTLLEQDVVDDERRRGARRSEKPAGSRPPRKTILEVAAESGVLDDVDKRADILFQQAQNMIDLDDNDSTCSDDQSHKKLIALVAHDNMKSLMSQFINEYRDLLIDFRLTGTETTCKTLRANGLEPESLPVASGPLGGDQSIGHFITTGEIRGLFFFRDPLSAHPHAADIEALSRLTDVYQIFFASNYRSAGGLLEKMHDTYVVGRHMRMNSVRLPGHIADLGGHVTDNYKKTRAAAVQNALSP